MTRQASPTEVFRNTLVPKVSCDFLNFMATPAVYLSFSEANARPHCITSSSCLP
jgi:hypothetical protein